MENLKIYHACIKMKIIKSLLGLIKKKNSNIPIQIIVKMPEKSVLYKMWSVHLMYDHANVCDKKFFVAYSDDSRHNILKFQYQLELELGLEE